MKKQIEDAIIRLQKSTAVDAEVRFTFNGQLNKSVTAKIFYGDGGKPSIDIVENKGYNPKYIQSKLKANFNLTVDGGLPYADTGDSVLTREYIDNPPAIGTVVNLSDTVYYFRVNTGLISCNGRQLGKDFKASFQGTETSICSTEGAAMKYSQFQLM